MGALLGIAARMGRWVVLAALGAAALPATAGATAITEFPLPAGADPLGVVAGADGNVWFTDGGTTKAVGRITPAGTITEFTKGLTGSPADITAGPDGNVWFTENGASFKAIAKITPAGTITEFPLPATSAPANILVGPDGNLWFSDVATPAIWRITPAGTPTKFTTTLNAMSEPDAMTVGPDGNLWFTDPGGKTEAIGRVTMAGVITEFTVGNGTSPRVNLITAGADGNVWFSDDGTSSIGRVTPSGTITEFTTGIQTGAQPDALTLGPDNNVWFNDQYSNQRAEGQVMATGAIKEFTSGLNSNLQDDITVGADGNLWIEQASPDMTNPGGIARITPAGAITEFTTGLLKGSGSDGDHIVSGPDGNLWFSDRGARAIGKVALQLPPTAKTGAATAVTNTTATVSGSVEPFGAPTTVTFQYGNTPALGSTVSAGTLPAGTSTSTVTAHLTGLSPGTTVYYQVVANNGTASVSGGVQTFKTTGSPPRPQIITALVGNQQITLKLPPAGTCLPSAARLAATLASAPGKHGTKLRFVSVALYLDNGIKHTRKRTIHPRHGRKRVITIVSYTANATARHLPLIQSLRLTGLKSGTHTLKVVLSYRETVTRRHRRTTITLTKTLRVRFRVC